MPELGLFPLQIVLLPGERLPLHIFEPRYKELIGECVERGEDFGLVLAEESGLRQIGTRAAVIEVLDRFEDGRMNVVVQGGERFRLVELTSGRSFQTAEVEPLADEPDGPPERADVERALSLFAQLVEVAGAEVEPPDAGSPTLSFELAGRVEFGAPVKQELLELRSEPARLRRLAELLEKAASGLALERDVRERAAGNGRVSPRPA